MRLLVVGAGASYAEAEHAGVPEDFRPPFVKNFAKRMWTDSNPHQLLLSFFEHRCIDPTDDPLARFIELEGSSSSDVSIEPFFEYAYHHGRVILPGHEQFKPASLYDNLLYHGILRPFTFVLLQGLLKDSVQNAPLALTKTVAGHLKPGDAVLNLNYDTIFEIGAEQAGHKLAFLPNKPSADYLAVSKPHGSFNLLVTEGGFYFAKPYFAGDVQPSDGSTNYGGFVPPRLNKHYDQHPIAHTILQATKEIQPTSVVFWGIGLTESDTDLLSLYQHWTRSAQKVEFINPSVNDLDKAKVLLGVDVDHYSTVADWNAGQEDPL
jgi:hypothetical protein